MPEREMNPRSGNARRFRIDADAGETAIEINLPAVLPKNRQPNNYKIVKKDIPQAARNKIYGGKKVKWINNFGIRLKGNVDVKQGGKKQDPFIDEVDGEQFSYEVIVPGPAPAGFPTLVYFDGTDVQPTGASADSDDNFRFSLNIGDPPMGWGG
jgi:hypothetical protein